MHAHPRPRADPLRVGLLFGALAVYLSLVGMVEALHGRALVSGAVRLSLGQSLLLLTGAGAGYLVSRRAAAAWPSRLLAGATAGLAAGGVLGLFLLVGHWVPLRTIFVNASPSLFRLLSLGQAPAPGAGLTLLLWTGLGAAGALAAALRENARRAVLWSGLVLLLGVFQELLQLLLRGLGLASLRRFLFHVEGPSLPGAAVVLLLAAAAALLQERRRGAVRAWIGGLPEGGRRAVRLALAALGLLGLLAVPLSGGPFVAQVLVIVGLYTLMGLGLNLEVGFAGLLDLGFVAFFAIGAYTVALLTSTGPLGIAEFSFWVALPIAVLVSLLAGVVLGVPVLGIRGDYLAIATLGFGEIVRLLVLSDFLRPWLGGSQGILSVPKPVIGDLELAGAGHLFYVTLASSALVAYVAWRLQHFALGRAWMAIREDEGVAQALGVDLVRAKLLAYGLGAAFAGVAGGIFAVMVGSVFPHSFQLLISINVLSLVIVGGLGSLPGVAVGALALIGLPELLREFGEFRFLVYGAALVGMMLLRPEGLLPAAPQRRELRAHTDAVAAAEARPAAAGPRGPVSPSEEAA